jgi:hypothetical protein
MREGHHTFVLSDRIRAHLSTVILVPHLMSSRYSPPKCLENPFSSRYDKLYPFLELDSSVPTQMFIFLVLAMYSLVRADCDPDAVQDAAPCVRDIFVFTFTGNVQGASQALIDCKASGVLQILTDDICIGEVANYVMNAYPVIEAEFTGLIEDVDDFIQNVVVPFIEAVP